jgi:hypothetical protein
MARKQPADRRREVFEQIEALLESLPMNDQGDVEKLIFYQPHRFEWAKRSKAAYARVAWEIGETERGRRRPKDMAPGGTETLSALIVRLHDDQKRGFEDIAEHVNKLMLRTKRLTHDAARKLYSREKKLRRDGDI